MIVLGHCAKCTQEIAGCAYHVDGMVYHPGCIPPPNARFANVELDALRAERDAYKSGAVSMKAAAEQAWKERDEALARVAKLETTITEANDALFDTSPMDVEHDIDCHADTLPLAYRQVAAGHAQALRILQAVVHELVGG